MVGGEVQCHRRTVFRSYHVRVHRIWLNPSTPRPLDPKELVTLEELTISNMCEVAALIEVLEKKGVMKKQDILHAIRELRQKNPKARTPLEFED